MSWGAFVCVFLLAQPTTRRAQGWCRPRSKGQVGFGKEDQDLVSASATAKNASCCPCAQRRLGIPDRDRPLPSSQPLARSFCGHTTRSRLADAEKVHAQFFKVARFVATSQTVPVMIKILLNLRPGSSGEVRGRRSSVPRSRPRLRSHV